MAQRFFGLKGILTSFFLVCFLTAQGREVFVNTQDECFYMDIASEATFDEITRRIQLLTDSTEMSSIIIEVPMSGGDACPLESIAWRPKARKHGQFLGYARDYFTELTPNEYQDIHYIVTFLANKSLLSIASHRGSLEDAGDRIDHIHPMRFLLTVFSNEELKVGMRNIRGKSWVWGDFVAGLKNSLATEMNIQNIREEYITHFSQSVGLDAGVFRSYLMARQWDDFIDVLITQIPRKGDHRRYGN